MHWVGKLRLSLNQCLLYPFRLSIRVWKCWWQILFLDVQVGKAGFGFPFFFLQSHNCSLRGAKRWGRGMCRRGASQRIYSSERRSCFKSKASAIVTQSFHFMNKRLTAYSDSLVLILSARAPLPFTNQRQNVIPASKMQRPEGQGLCAPTKICATLTDNKKGEESGGKGGR